MDIKTLTFNSQNYPQVLRRLKGRPKQLYCMGANLNELLLQKSVAIVGTRTISIYGEQVTRKFASELAEQGLIIVSGLALGVDELAHRSALEAGGQCIAVLPCPLDNIVPNSNQKLAEQIVEQGGALVSEYAPGEPPFKQYFIARNRIMSGLADAVLITEAGAKSGALHTAGFAEAQNKPLFAVPGNITNIGSVGVNNLIKSHKAAMVSEPKDVLLSMGITPHQTPSRRVHGRNQNEQTLLNLMLEGVSDGDKLMEKSGLSLSEFNRALTMLEIASKVRPLGMNHWAIY